MRLSRESDSTLSRTMNDYRIEKYRLPVAVTLVGGVRMAGDVFVQAHARYRAGPEDAGDLFNSREPFFPIATDGDTHIVAKAMVTEVEADIVVDDDPLRRASAAYALVEIVMTDGTVRTGSVYLEVPIERPRLLDFLNFYNLRFLTLHTVDGARLINCRHIARVRPLD